MCPCTSSEFDIPTRIGDIVPIGFVHDGPAFLLVEAKEGFLGTELRLESPYGSIRVEGADHESVKQALALLTNLVHRTHKISH